MQTASFLRSNGAFQYLTGRKASLITRPLHRFLLQAPESFRRQMHRANDRLLQNFIDLPTTDPALILDLDRSAVTFFGRQESAQVGYNPRSRGKRSYNPSLCIEAKSSGRRDAELGSAARAMLRVT
jgi:hypothetical protein